MPSEAVPIFPLLNACLNGTATLLLIAGFVAIKRGSRLWHARLMGAAFCVSVLFLGSYLWYHTHYPPRPYPPDGRFRTLYMTILGTHVPMAMVIVPFILRLLWLAYRKKYEKHRDLGRIVWPAWIYVSVTGVLVYLMLYEGLGQ